MKKILFLSLFSLIILVSCKDNTTSPVSQTVIWPLAVGNYWVIKISIYDSTGKSVFIQIDTMKVISDSIINSEKVYNIQLLHDTIFSFDYNYLCNRADGLYNYFNINNSFVASLVLKYSGNAGDTYISDSSTIKIDSINAIVKVPAGNFECYKYSVEYFNGFYWEKGPIYLSPGIGFIYEEYYIPLNYNSNSFRLAMTWELLSYKLY
ncbi:MAG: hypothetical protein ABSG15_13760 [FCB group bacterium]